MYLYNPVLAIPLRHIHKAKPRDRYLSSDEIRNYYTTLLNSRCIDQEARARYYHCLPCFVNLNYPGCKVGAYRL